MKTGERLFEEPSFTLSRLRRSFGRGKSKLGIHKRKVFSSKVAHIQGVSNGIHRKRESRRVELKKLFPQFKFSVTRQNYSSINIKIMKGDIDFFDDAMRADGTNQYGDSRKLSDYAKENGHTSVNEYYIKENWAGEAQKMLSQIRDIACKGNYNRNAGDMGADYPDWNFFVHISIGSYDKPYELNNQVAKAA